MQERADRGRGDHRRRQPAVERHHRGLADPEQVERHQHRHHPVGCSAGENPARDEVEAAGRDPGEPDREQQGPDRGPEQDAEIDPARAPGLLGAAMGHQRIGADRQHLVEHQKRQHVAGEGDAHGRGQREREEGVEAGLVGLVMAAHVADRIDRGQDPEQARDQREADAQRLGGEGEAEARQHLDQTHLRPLARDHRRQHEQHQREQAGRGDQRHGLAQVGPGAGQPDQQRADHRRRQRQQHRGAGAHDAGPISARAAASARPMVQLELTPNTMQAPARNTSGSSIPSGASRTASRPSGAGAK